MLKAPRRIFDYLQATASAADPSSIRRIDVWIQSALVSSVSSAGQILARPVVVRQLDSVINRMQQFHNEEWHSDLEVNILSNLASISARFNSSDGTASVETQTLKQRVKLLRLVSSAGQVLLETVPASAVLSVP